MSKPPPQPIEPSLVARISQGLRYIATGSAPGDWFGPGLPEPAPQAPPEVAGRAFDFPTGYNTGTQLRAYEAIGFPELRALAESWDLLRLVIETRKDQLEKLDWSIQPRQLSPTRQTLAAAGPDPRIEAIESFLRLPDREHAWGTWLRLLLEDLFVIDAPTLYLRRDRIGRLYALEVVDGATIKRILDDNGRTPAAPAPAYRQILKGVPAVDYTTDELIYMPRNPRPQKVYGYSPVEQIVLTVNVALRRALSQLQYYTEGNVPEALIGVPASWSPDQIRQFQLYWDSLMEGNIAARRHARFIPGDMKYQPTRDPVLKDPYDEWLARIACFAFSVAPTPFISQVNRATAESAQDAALAEGLAPLQIWVKRLIDTILAREFGVPDLEFAWALDREQDPAAQAGIDQIYVQSGVKSIDEVRATLGLAPIGYGNAVMGLQPYPVAPGANSSSAVGKTRAALKYSPDQPRVPAGDPTGGQWTSGDGAGEGDTADGISPTSDEQVAQSDDGLHDPQTSQLFLLDEPPVTIRPPLPEFPNDPTQPPGPGWIWKGGPGSQPGDSNGAWVDPKTGGSLHPDMDHLPPEQPHWDYRPFKNGPQYRWYPDGRVELNA